MSSQRFLMIETGTEICSVALSYGDSVSDEIVIREPRSHTRVLGSIIDELLKRNRITIDDCDAVAVSEGPGSYTGLRVGVSAAKGLCYGSGKPLIAVNSLLVIARLAIEQSLLPSEDSLIYAILDAKRDEVYLRKFLSDGTPISETEAVVIVPGLFDEVLTNKTVVFAGDAAEKCSRIINHPNAFFKPIDSVASGMFLPVAEAFNRKIFADTAYFEPFYLKDFVIGTTKKRLF